jgi:Rad3-related DNA helicase
MFRYNSLFPHVEIRESQSEAIDFALDALINKKKKYVIVEAGTGVGKSAIAVTVSRYMNNLRSEPDDYSPGSYFVTTQKLLQEQYVKDFGNTRGCMKSIKSSSNYRCSYHRGNTCKISQQLLRNADRSSKFFKRCTFNCSYKNDKKDFLESSESVTNFPYLLTEATYSKKITPRDLLIIDEAHNIEAELSKFIEVTISERFVKHALKLHWTDVNTQFKAMKWIQEVYYPKVKSQLKHVEKSLEKMGMVDRLKEFESLSKQHDLLRSHVKKVGTFLSVYDKDNWVFDLIPGYGRSMRKFTFKPIDISPFADEYLFRLGKQVIMMSATILDMGTFCESLGIREEDVEAISLPSPFPVENHPVLISPIGSMSAKMIDQTLPRMSAAISEILDQHKDEKGIIHCHTYKIAKFLKNNIKNSRLLIHNTENREKILKRHLNTKEPTVLLSPSMSEGVDLKDDLSRFQVLVKIPYPYLGDPLVKKRMNKWEGWYSLQTAKKIVQAIGRSVRSYDDNATSYVLDSDWNRFYGRNRKIFPDTFKKSLMS